MDMADDLRQFHRVDRMRVVTHLGVLDRPWPDRAGLPSHGYVAPRHELDHRLLETVRRAGATIWENTEVLGPLVQDGAVVGARVRRDGEESVVHAPVTVAADGMSSRICRSLAMVPGDHAPFGLAIRAQVACQRPEDSVLECYVNLRQGSNLLPGYGWVFPMGNGRINLGVGYLSTYAGWKRLNINHVMRTFVDSLPERWEVPSVSEMQSSGSLQGWRLPMALGVWPPWRPGLLAVGDAVAAAKPFTGAGISKALESGMLAGEVASEAIRSRNPYDLSDYERRLWDKWGVYYRVARGFSRLIGHPLGLRAVVSTGVRTKRGSDFFFDLFTGNGHRPDEPAPRSSRLLLRAAARRADKGTSLDGRTATVRRSRYKSSHAGSTSHAER